jgi:hypothetical protein
MKECLLILWMILTLILTFSLVGLVLFIPRDGRDNSTWMEMGDNLLAAVVNNKWFLCTQMCIFWVSITGNILPIMIPPCATYCHLSKSKIQWRKLNDVKLNVTFSIRASAKAVLDIRVTTGSMSPMALYSSGVTIRTLSLRTLGLSWWRSMVGSDALLHPLTIRTGYTLRGSLNWPTTGASLTIWSGLERI